VDHLFIAGHQIEIVIAPGDAIASREHDPFRRTRGAYVQIIAGRQVEHDHRIGEGQILERFGPERCARHDPVIHDQACIENER
jgi:hypothetical protein